jgi:hypothetical protein
VSRAVELQDEGRFVGNPNLNSDQKLIWQATYFIHWRPCTEWRGPFSDNDLCDILQIGNFDEEGK